MIYARSILRFWWIALIGVFVATLVGLELIYRIDVSSGWPPVFTERARTSYVAATELLVDSPSGPYLRSSQRSVQPVLPTRAKGEGAKGESAAKTADAVAVPETKTLVDAANLYPLFIESDRVTALRLKLLGRVPGSVRAKALYALQNPNRFRPSVLPVIQIVSSSPTPEAAIKLADGTARAFSMWLTAEQRRTRVPPNQRVIVRQLRAPQSAAAVGGPKYGLPLLAASGILFAYLALAVVLDRAFPRRRPVPDSESEDDSVLLRTPDREGLEVAPAASTSNAPK